MVYSIMMVVIHRIKYLLMIELMNVKVLDV